MKKFFITLITCLLLAAAPAFADWEDRPSYTSQGRTPATSDDVMVRDLDDPTDDAANGTVVRGTLLQLFQAMQEWIQNGDDFRLYTTTSGHAWAIQIYDNDGAAWVDCLTFTNGNTPTISLGTGCQLSGLGSINLASATDYDVNGANWLDDTKGNGDTGNLWSADKIYDQLALKLNKATFPVSIGVAASDETTDLTTGTAKVTFRMPHAMTLSEVRASVSTAPTHSTTPLTVDINEGGTTILSTKITFDTTEKTSTTATTAPVISDTALADDAEITVDIDSVGDTTAGKGLKIWLIGTRNIP